MMVRGEGRGQQVRLTVIRTASGNSSPSPSSAIDKLLARGTVFGGCNLALRGHARRRAKNAGLTAADAAKEFTANTSRVSS
jgi:hypothetical protein